jgi:hypothetical protein
VQIVTTLRCNQLSFWMGFFFFLSNSWWFSLNQPGFSVSERSSFRGQTPEAALQYRRLPESKESSVWLTCKCIKKQIKGPGFSFSKHGKSTNPSKNNNNFHPYINSKKKKKPLQKSINKQLSIWVLRKKTKSQSFP